MQDINQCILSLNYSLVTKHFRPLWCFYSQALCCAHDIGSMMWRYQDEAVWRSYEQYNLFWGIPVLKTKVLDPMIAWVPPGYLLVDQKLEWCEEGSYPFVLPDWPKTLRDLLAVECSCSVRTSTSPTSSPVKLTYRQPHLLPLLHQPSWQLYHKHHKPILHHIKRNILLCVLIFSRVHFFEIVQKQ
jgi:hypothetical protein